MWKKFKIYSIKKKLARKCRAFYATLYQEVFFLQSRGGSLSGKLHRTLGTIISPFYGVIIIEVPPNIPPPHPPSSTANLLPLHWQPLGLSSGPFPGFRHWSTLPCPFNLSNPRISNMSYDNKTVLNAVMEFSWERSPYAKLLHFTRLHIGKFLMSQQH